MSTDETREALDVAAIRARAEDFREAIEASSDRVGVRAIKSARDVPDLLAEVERLRGSADAWWTEYDRELKAHEATKAEREQVVRSGRAVARGATARIEILTAERDAARAALDRAKAEALREAAKALGENQTAREGDVREWLNNRAAALDPEEEPEMPTGAHLRALPRERYDAVMDSGPTDPDEGADCG